MVRIRLLGELGIDVGGTPREPPAGPRVRGVLGWLALHPGPQPRRELAARFWPDVLESSSRASLRSALWAVRAALGPEGEHALVADRDRVGLAGEEAVWTDVREFRQLVAAGRYEE